MVSSWVSNCSFLDKYFLYMTLLTLHLHMNCSLLESTTGYLMSYLFQAPGISCKFFPCLASSRGSCLSLCSQFDFSIIQYILSAQATSLFKESWKLASKQNSEKATWSLLSLIYVFGYVLILKVLVSQKRML